MGTHYATAITANKIAVARLAGSVIEEYSWDGNMGPFEVTNDHYGTF
jgi:hypothetical protein